jgi:hypothetical protein
MAPELHQPYRKHLRQTPLEPGPRPPVRAEDPGRDRYEGPFGRVYYRDLDVNAEMVREGKAWVFSALVLVHVSGSEQLTSEPTLTAAATGRAHPASLERYPCGDGSSSTLRLVADRYS